jgi:uncharacterized hydrophobic protein (TIGR00271 family)
VEGKSKQTNGIGMSEQQSGQQTEQSQEVFLGELRLGSGFMNASRLGVMSGVIFMGIFILLAQPILSTTGIRAPWTAVMASAVLVLSLLSVAELLGGSAGRGGTYNLVHETVGGPLAFLTGWALLAGSLALAAGLAHYFAELGVAQFKLEPRLTPWLALSVVILVVIFQVLQLLPRRRQQNLVVIALAVFFGLAVLFVLPQLRFSQSRSFGSVNLTPITLATAWLVCGYIAFEAMIASRQQLQQPARQFNRAMFALLGAAGGAFSLALLVMAGLGLGSGAESSNPWVPLGTSSIFPGWLMLGSILVALVMATNGCLMVAARQIHALSLEGALPSGFRRVWRGFPLPISLFALLAILATPLVLWGAQIWLINSAAALFLLGMTSLNGAAIYSQRAEPERRRPFAVPFAPLVPALAIAANLVLLRALPVQTWVGILIWLGTGLLYYLVYARHQQVAAQEGEVVFGRAGGQEQRRKHRILVPIGPNEDRHFILRMANTLAFALQGEVIPLQVIPVSDPLAIEEGQRIAHERNTLFRWSIRTAEDMGVPTYPITRLARSVPEGIIDTATEEACDLVLMSWPVKTSGQDISMGTVLSRVAREVTCDVVVVAYRPERANEHPKKREEDTQPRTIKKILVPTAGGPNAPLASQLALLLAGELDAKVGSVYVASPNASDEELQQGSERIEQTLAAMQEMATDLPALAENPDWMAEIEFEGQVIQASNVVDGIAAAGADYDLVFIGASEESLIDQVLFGNIPVRVASECPVPVVIVKRYRGLPRLWLRRSWNAIYEALPTLSQEQKIEVLREVHSGARPDVDFFVMIGLSALIATFGLLQNSTAVIIGAMLVAPLFSPIVAISLAIAQGNIRMLRLGIESAVKGLALAIGLATLLTLIIPVRTITPEISARITPSLLDLAVALVSGMAGAYAVARKDVATALPGVAIAAALVPPLGVVGIGLANGDLKVAGGGSLLFLINLIAIALAGAITFLMLGFQPGTRRSKELSLRRGLGTAVTLLVLVMVPLAVLFVQTLQASQRERIIRAAIGEALQKYPSVELVDSAEIEIDLVATGAQGESITLVTVPLYVMESLDSGLADQLSLELDEVEEQPVRIRLVSYPVLESRP